MCQVEVDVFIKGTRVNAEPAPGVRVRFSRLFLG